MSSKKIAPPKRMSARKANKQATKPAKASKPIHINLPTNAASLIKDYAQKQEDAVLDQMLSMAGGMPGMPPGMGGIFGEIGGFANAMVCQSLLKREEGIIRAEWYESRGVNSIESSAEAIDRYVVARAKAEKQLGKEALEAQLAQARAEHNECARINLNNSNGMLYCYVLPDFNPDGTHGPVGPKDIPWNQKG